MLKMRTCVSPRNQWPVAMMFKLGISMLAKGSHVSEDKMSLARSACELNKIPQPVHTKRMPR